MKYVIDKTNRPVYLQIYRQIRQDIIEGIYHYHGKLPSIRLLCDELSVSTVTVDHAYALLCDEGYIESRERSGYFVTYRRADFVPISESEIHTIPTENHYYTGEFPFSVLAKTMRNVISKYGQAHHQIQPPP